MIDDAAIIAALDSSWLTVPAIHKRLGYVGLAHQLGRALRRLAASGSIEVSRRVTGAGHYSIYCYRRKEPAAAEGIVAPG